VYLHIEEGPFDSLRLTEIEGVRAEKRAGFRAPALFS
jgi:hypothetical protein